MKKNYQPIIIYPAKLSFKNKDDLRNSLAVQWLGLYTLTGLGLGSITGWGTKIPQAVRCGQKKPKPKPKNKPKKKQKNKGDL